MQRSTRKFIHWNGLKQARSNKIFKAKWRLSIFNSIQSNRQNCPSYRPLRPRLKNTIMRPGKRIIH